jgi:iron complex transport system substrate-binding protein
MRIASLLPSATEIVAALGRADDLVGVTFECDMPPGITERCPVLVHGLATANKSAAEIDAMVRDLSATGQPMYRLNEQALTATAPDVILTQDLCRVCALPSGDVDAALDHLGCTAEVISLDPHRLGEVIDTITTIGDAIGAIDEARALTAELFARLRDAQTGAASGRRAFILEWPDPPFLAGHWVPDLITAAGADAVLAFPGERSVETTWEAISAADPEVVIVAPCGFGLSDAVSMANDAMSSLPPNAEVWAIDANGYTVRPGPRLIDAVAQIGLALSGAETDDHIMVRIR